MKSCEDHCDRLHGVSCTSSAWLLLQYLILRHPLRRRAKLHGCVGTSTAQCTALVVPEEMIAI